MSDELKEVYLENIAFELYDMLQQMHHKATKGRIKEPKNEKIRIDYCKSFIQGCNVMGQLLNQMNNSKQKETKRGSISGRTRLNVLDRDNYTCQICGATVEAGATLHIDHIIPISKGGTNDESNLQVLCDRCNLAKNNRVDLKHDMKKLMELKE